MPRTFRRTGRIDRPAIQTSITFGLSSRYTLIPKICKADSKGSMMTAKKQMADTVLLDHLEDVIRAGERIVLDYGDGNGFLAGSQVGPSLRDALVGLVARMSSTASVSCPSVGSEDEAVALKSFALALDQISP